MNGLASVGNIVPGGVRRHLVAVPTPVDSLSRPASKPIASDTRKVPGRTVWICWGFQGEDIIAVVDSAAKARATIERYYSEYYSDIPVRVEDRNGTITLVADFGSDVHEDVDGFCAERYEVR